MSDHEDDDKITPGAYVFAVLLGIVLFAGLVSILAIFGGVLAEHI